MKPIFLRNMDIEPGKFLQWWRHELLALVPEKLRAVLGTEKKPPLFIRTDNSHICLQVKTDNSWRELLNLPADADGKARIEQFFAGQPEYLQSEKILLLDKQQALLRRVTLPAAAADNIRQVLGYEMNRYTPFTEAELHYDVQIIEKNKVAQQTTAELAATPKPVLAALYQTLSGWSLAIDRAAPADAVSPRCNVLPEELRPKIDRAPELSRNILAGSLLLLLIAAMALPLWMKSRYVDELNEKAAVAAKKVKEIEKIKSGAQALLHGVEKLTALKENEPSMLQVLNELTRLLPANTWINSFQYANHKIQIQGLSASASALIGILEESPVFKQVSFISPVIPDRQSGQDRFQIAMEIVVKQTASAKDEHE